MIFGVFMLLLIGTAPMSSPNEKFIPLNPFEFMVQPQRHSDYLPVETTLDPLTSLDDHTYLSDEDFAAIDWSSYEPNSFVEFDLETRTKKIISNKDALDGLEYDPDLFQPKKGIKPTYNGHIGDMLAAAASELGSSSLSIYDTIRASTIFPPDDRAVVADTTAFPFSSVVKIYVTTPDGPRYMGSGAIIDDTHVLTVAHVGYIIADGGLVTSMEIIPGKTGSYEPYGSYYARHIRMPMEWLISASSQYDYALVTLAQPIGATTGYMGVATYNRFDPVYTSKVYTAGYPGDLSGGYVMYNTTDVGTSADEWNHWFKLDTYGGQSGSAIWTKNSSGEYIISILAYEYGQGDGAGSNFGTRISQDVYNQLASWIGQDEDPVEKPEFRPIFWDTTAEPWQYLYKGQTKFRILSDIENLGRMDVEELTVGFYLTNDSELTLDDYLIGTKTIGNLDVLESKAVNWYGNIPRSVPNNRYRIGFIIDPFNELDEYEEDNNAKLVGTIQIVVANSISYNFFTSPLGLGLTIGGGTLIVGGTTAGIVIGVKKRKKRNISPQERLKHKQSN